MAEKKNLIIFLCILLVIIGCSSTDHEETEKEPTQTDIEKMNFCQTDNDCKRAGCSAQLCVPKTENPMSTCEYKEEYACLEKVKCGCFNGRCAWNKNENYDDCVAQLI